MGAVIGLDARMIGPVPTGLGNYASSLVRALTSLDTAHTYVVIRSPAAPPTVPLGRQVSEVVIAGDLDTPANLVRGRAISGLGLDLYHSLHHFVPPGVRVPRVVVTLHDLIWIEHRSLIRDGGFAALTSTATNWFARAAIGYAMTRADRVIAVSSYTRDRALAYYRLDPSRITVVRHGIDHAAFAPSTSAAPGSPRYFLCLGNTRPYKNIPSVLHAFAQCARDLADVDLVVAGRGDSTEPLQRLARQLGIGDRLRFMGIVDDRQRLELLQGAIALVFPSIVEGFGFPVLEAMTAGCPVVTSTCPALVELADDAALVCHAERADEIAAAMTRLATEPELRSTLRDRGLHRAATFTWPRSAEQTLRVYEGALERVTLHAPRAPCAS
jgi:glycosyltransferase involved in cell wall biosynthesis